MSGGLETNIVNKWVTHSILNALHTCVTTIQLKWHRYVYLDVTKEQ